MKSESVSGKEYIWLRATRVLLQVTSYRVEELMAEICVTKLTQRALMSRQ